MIPVLRRWVVLAGATALLLVSGCSINGLSFVQDDRIEIMAPGANDRLGLPLEVEWTAANYDGDYAVFFDRSPMKPGQSLLSLVSENDACRAEPGCPDAQWLADHQVYVTNMTTLRVEQLADRRENNRSEDRHEVVIVLLDESGRRVGESAFTNEFIIERED
jgi:hypothetical protein